jgi:hypothetical protein
MGFLEQLQQLSVYANSTKLNILIWGSGPSYKEHFEKRGKIREEIAKQFIQASVHFSEDPELREELRKAIGHVDDLTVPEQELWHLGACDVCVALDTSEGVHQEIAHYIGSQWSYRMLILTNSKYKGSTGFPAMLREKQLQIFYDDAEYESCNLVSRVATRIKQVALGKISGLKA